MYGKASSTVKIAFRRPIGLPQKAFQFDIAFGLLKIKQKKKLLCMFHRANDFLCLFFISQYSKQVKVSYFNNKKVFSPLN